MKKVLFSAALLCAFVFSAETFAKKASRKIASYTGDNRIRNAVLVRGMIICDVGWSDFNNKLKPVSLEGEEYFFSGATHRDVKMNYDDGKIIDIKAIERRNRVELCATIVAK